MVKSINEQLKCPYFLKKIIFLSLISIFILLFDISNSQAKETCFQNNLYCVDTVTTDDITAIYVKSNQTYDITVTLKFTTFENVEADIDLPFIETIEPNSKVNILNLHILDKTKKWSYRYLALGVKGSIDAEPDYDHIYSLPYESGQTFKVSQGFNGKFSHNGEQIYAVDWSMPIGTPIYAARDGVVAAIESRNTIGGPDKKLGDKANYIYIKHSDDTLGAYLHLKQNGVRVKLGQKVKAGDFIGLSGNTGWTGGPHLHFWVYKVKDDGTMRESIPITFETSDQDETVLIQGKSYTAP